MNDDTKKIILNNSRKNVEEARKKVKKEVSNVVELNSKDISHANTLSNEDRVVFLQIKYNLENRLGELETLYGSPYFFKCKISYEGSNEVKVIHFAKFELANESIYSWVAPISSIRFEDPGEFSFRLPSGEIRKGILESKEQYLIVDGEIVFLTVEGLRQERELVYQKHFTSKKGFMLPEIVAQMEKAQDKVIREKYQGSMVISGPAGSGKTTLAFHRVAYLMQSPDSSELFPSESVLILVQDKGAVDYFSHLLPELGIDNVKINSFSSWAMNILGVEDKKYVERVVEDDLVSDRFEYEKLKVLRNNIKINFNKNIFKCLEDVYKKELSSDSYNIFLTQKKDGVLDRFDLAILLGVHKEKNNGIKRNRRLVNYSMILIDEFQNYLPEQINLFKSVLDQKTKSLIYVGDMDQQIRIGTIKRWEQIQDKIEDERNILLSKVYRNTKQILKYIEHIGYEVSIPEGLLDGPEVSEFVFPSIDDQVDYVRKIIEGNKGKTIGVIGKNSMSLAPFVTISNLHENVHLLPIEKAQGVEFDVVLIIDINENTFKVENIEGESDEEYDERRKIQKDLLYIALTRSMRDLHILGSKKLSDLIV